MNVATFRKLHAHCRTKKELASVLDHLQRRWEASCPGTTWPEGQYALRLFPTAAMPILAGASWGRPNLPEALTVRLLHPAPIF